MIREPIALHAVTWEAARTAARVEAHDALHVPMPPTLSDDEIKATGTELRTAGLLNGTQVHPDLVATMQLLATPARQIWGWWGQEDERRPRGLPDTGVVAAQNERGEAVLAVRDSRAVRLTPLGTMSVAEGFVRALSPHPPAPGGPITVDRGDYNAVIGGRGDRDDALAEQVMVAAGSARPRPPSPAVQMQAVLQQPRLGGGHAYGGMRDRMNRRQVSAPVHWLDTPDGRWLLAERGTQVVLTPCSADTLRSWLAASLPDSRA